MEHTLACRWRKLFLLLRPCSRSRCPRWATRPDGVALNGTSSRRCTPCSRSCCAIAAEYWCSLSWKTCTWSIPPRWNCSGSWWIKVPPPGFLALFTCRPGLQPTLDGALASHRGYTAALAASGGDSNDGPSRCSGQGVAPPGGCSNRAGQDRWRAAVCGGSPPRWCWSRDCSRKRRRSADQLTGPLPPWPFPPPCMTR